MGIAYVAMGNRERALESLEDYKRRNAGDPNVDTLIDAIRNGRIEFRRHPG